MVELMSFYSLLVDLLLARVSGYLDLMPMNEKTDLNESEDPILRHHVWTSYLISNNLFTNKTSTSILLLLFFEVLSVKGRFWKFNGW